MIFKKIFVGLIIFAFGTTTVYAYHNNKDNHETFQCSQEEHANCNESNCNYEENNCSKSRCFDALRESNRSSNHHKNKSKPCCLD